MEIGRTYVPSRIHSVLKILGAFVFCVNEGHEQKVVGKWWHTDKPRGQENRGKGPNMVSRE